MKKIIFSLSLAAIGAASHASILDDASKLVRDSVGFSAGSFVMPFEVKGRSGSKRVGGYNSKGKGSRYVGGRR